jgi:hypothetical protein
MMSKVITRITSIKSLGKEPRGTQEYEVMSKALRAIHTPPTQRDLSKLESRLPEGLIGRLPREGKKDVSQAYRAGAKPT